MRSLCAFHFLAILFLLNCKVLAFQSSCYKLFEHNSIGHQYNKLSYEHFDMVNLKPGLHGGQRVVVKRKGSWFDFKKELLEKGDLVIDLRLMPHILGKKEARFFGFEIIDNYHITLPDVKELTGAIEKFNAALPKGDRRRIEMSYYPIAGVHNSVSEYFERFIKNKEIPISLKGKSFFHDISAHSMQGFFIDNRIVNAIHERAVFINRLTQTLNSSFQGTSFEKEIKKTSQHLKTQIVSLIDQQAGFLSLSVYPELRSYMGRVGIEQHAEGVSMGLKDKLESSDYSNVEKNGAIHFFATKHFQSWLVNKNFKAELYAYYITKAKLELGDRYTQELNKLIYEVFENYFKENNPVLSKFSEVSHLIENADNLETFILKHELPSKAKVSLTSKLMQNIKYRKPRNTKRTLSEFETLLSEEPVTQVYIQRLKFLRENLNRL